MKLNKLNYISEAQQLKELIMLIESVFDGNDLDDITRDDANILGGIKALEAIAAGGSEAADAMSYEEIELAAAVFKKMSTVLAASKDELIEQMQVNKLTQKKDNPENYRTDI